MSKHHHLIIGGAGAIGVACAYYLHSAGESVSVLIRESHRNKFRRNEQGKDCLTYYDLIPYFRLNSFIWLSGNAITLLFCYYFTSWITLILTFALVCYFGSLVHRIVRPLLPTVSPTLVPLRMTAFSLNDVAKVNQEKTINFIWIAISTPQLYQYDLKPLIDLLPNAFVVNLTPFYKDYPYLLEKYPTLKGRLIQGTNPLLSHQVPLKVSLHSLILQRWDISSSS